MIRRAVPSDAPDICRLLGELGYESDVASVRGRLDVLARGSNDAVFVANTASTVHGVVSVHVLPLFHTGGNIARITALVVASNTRRAGIGTQLVRAVEEFAAASRCERMELTSADHRSDAHAFYEALGFHRVSQRFVRTISAG